MTRRTFLAIGAYVSAACLTRPTQNGTAREGRLAARPAAAMKTITPGEHRLGLGEARDGLLYVPRMYDPRAAAPLAVMFHGAGGTSRGMAFTFREADESGTIVLAPDSREGRTWDVILGGFGPDLEFLDRALAYTFDRCAIDRARIGVGGFSDGASYALSVGLSNGDLFTHVLAFSPGFVARGEREGRPRVYISHGTSDAVLPITQTSRRIVPSLRADGYDVTYREFDGGHEVPPANIEEAFGLLVK